MRSADKAMVGIVAAACLLVLIIVLKNVLLVHSEVLSRDMVIYIIIYFGFITAVNLTGKSPETERGGGRT